MEITRIFVGVLLFAAATAILYSWGMVKQQRQSGDLLNLLFAKGENKIKKYMRTNDSITHREVEKLCDGMQAKFPFSGNRAVVKDTKDFSRKLLDYMVKTGQLSFKNGKYFLEKGEK